MRKSEYKIDLVKDRDGNVRLKHNAKVRIVLKSGNKILEDSFKDVDRVGGEKTVYSVMYNRLSYSGGVSWWNPATGEPLPKAPSLYYLVREEDILTGDQECDCTRCVG